jgi:uncharacterized protein with GYD domain
MTQIHWTLGHYDSVAAIEAKDDRSAAAFAMAVGATGNVRSQTLRAFAKEERTGMLGKLG